MVYNFNNNQEMVDVGNATYDYSTRDGFGYNESDFKDYDDYPSCVPLSPCDPCPNPCAPNCCQQVQIAGMGLVILLIGAILLLIIVASAQLSNALQEDAPSVDPYTTLVILTGVIAAGWLGIPLGLAAPFSAAIDSVVEAGKSCCPCPESKPGDLSCAEKVCFEKYLLGLVWIALQVASTWVLALAVYVAVIIYLMFVPNVYC
jgi:hypothetical protein